MVGMQHEGVSGSEVGVQRVYTKSTSTDLLELMEDIQEVGLVFLQRRMTRWLLTLILSSVKNGTERQVYFIKNGNLDLMKNSKFKSLFT